MAKTATLNLRVNPDVKENAENILSQLGIPFALTLPKVADSVSADLMTREQIHEKLDRGYADIEKGNTRDATSAFAKFRETHK